MRCVPGAIEYRLLSVRSMRAPRSTNVMRIVTPMNSTASARSAPAPYVLRAVVMLRVVISVRLLHVEHDHGGEIQQVADVDHSFGDRAEVREERQRGDRIDHRLRRPPLEGIQHQRET